MPTHPFSAFTPVERRILAEALARHADALEDILRRGETSNGFSVGDLRSDAVIARTLRAAFTA